MKLTLKKKQELDEEQKAMLEKLALDKLEAQKRRDEKEAAALKEHRAQAKKAERERKHQTNEAAKKKAEQEELANAHLNQYLKLNIL